MKIRNDLFKNIKTDRINSTFKYSVKSVFNDNFNIPICSTSPYFKESLRCEFCEYFKEVTNFLPLQY